MKRQGNWNDEGDALGRRDAAKQSEGVKDAS